MKKNIKKTKKDSPKKIKDKKGIALDPAFKSLIKGDVGDVQQDSPFFVADPSHAWNRYEPKFSMSDKDKRFPLICLCLPVLTNSSVSIDWAIAFRRLGGMLGCGIAEVFMFDEKVDDARNNCVRQSLASGADYTFFLGSDVICPSDVISRLYERNVDMACGVYWTKQWPTQPYIWNEKGIKGPYTDWKVGEFFKVQYSGVDCILINNDVFRAMEEPWFDCNWSYTDSAPPMGITTEDFYFYHKAAELGYDLWCDSGIQCLHQDRHTRQLFGLTTEMKQAEHIYKDVKKVKKVADFRLRDTTPMHLGEMVSQGGELHRFDIRPKVKPDYRTNLTSIPAKTGTYDYINADNALEFFQKDQLKRTLREWFRVIKVGGEFSISVPNIDYYQGSDKLFEFNCGFSPESLIKLITSTKMVSDVKVACTNTNLIANGTIKTNRKWEILDSRERLDNDKNKKISE